MIVSSFTFVIPTSECSYSHRIRIARNLERWEYGSAQHAPSVVYIYFGGLTVGGVTRHIVIGFREGVKGEMIVRRKIEPSQTMCAFVL